VSDGILRIYRGGRQQRDGSTVVVSSHVMDAANTSVAEDRRTLAFVGGKGPPEHQDYGIDLPLRTLSVGGYLLKVDVTSARERLSRAATFQVR
jgi:hypothetical protein